MNLSRYLLLHSIICETKKAFEIYLYSTFYEALLSCMRDDIKIRLKRRDAMRSGKGKQLLNIKTAVERPILKLG